MHSVHTADDWNAWRTLPALAEHSAAHSGIPTPPATVAVKSVLNHSAHSIHHHHHPPHSNSTAYPSPAHFAYPRDTSLLHPHNSYSSTASSRHPSSYDQAHLTLPPITHLDRHWPSSSSPCTSSLFHYVRCVTCLTPRAYVLSFFLSVLPLFVLFLGSTSKYNNTINDGGVGADICFPSFSFTHA